MIGRHVGDKGSDGIADLNSTEAHSLRIALVNEGLAKLSNEFVDFRGSFGDGSRFGAKQSFWDGDDGASVYRWIVTDWNPHI